MKGALILQLDVAFITANDVNPLLEIRLELRPPEIVFNPDLYFNPPPHEGLGDVITGWLSGFVSMATIIKRLDTGDGDYLVDVQDDIELKRLVSQIKYVELIETMKFYDFSVSYLINSAALS
jgi:dynein heavy chain, axonemal